MFDRKILDRIKSCTAAIGLIEKDANFPFQLWGSGFFVSPKGYIVTAAHVSDRCLDSIDLWKATGKELERAVFFSRRDSQGKFHFYAARIEQRVFRSQMVQKPKGYTMPTDIDVVVFNIGQKKEIHLEHLAIKAPNEIELYEDVAMASYPNGLQSMNWQVDAYVGARLSPIIQTGKLVNFFPMDDAQIPNGIQTDIIGTGGSSGAAIVDTNGKVVGIALQVIKSGVSGENGVTNLATNTGLTYGLSSNILKAFVGRLDEFFEQGNNDIMTPIDMTVFGDQTYDRI